MLSILDLDKNSSSFLISEAKKNLEKQIVEYSPYTNSTKLDELDSFMVFGFDFKINPSREIKVIEVNGISSGMHGFEETISSYIYGTPRPVEFDFQDIFDVTAYDKNSCDDAIRKYIKKYGDAQVAYVGKRLAEERMYPLRFGEVLIHNYGRFDTKAYPEFDMFFGLEYNDITRKLIDMNKATEDKLVIDKLFDNIRDTKPKSYVYDEQGFAELSNNCDSDIFVIKPINGKRGKEVRFFDRDNPLHFNSDYIVEEFIKSKPILSENDRELHDGCMRYMLIVEQDTENNLEINHFGGYWRLCPAPITSNIRLDSMRANLSQGAIPERVEHEDMNLVVEFIDKNIPLFYRNLLSHI
jgi:hypothetical protein